MQARKETDFRRLEQLIEKAERTLEAFKNGEERRAKGEEPPPSLLQSTRCNQSSLPSVINRPFEAVFGVLSLIDNTLRMSPKMQALAKHRFVETGAKVYRIVIDWQMIEPEGFSDFCPEV
jgi:hypothetical protein